MQRRLADTALRLLTPLNSKPLASQHSEPQAGVEEDGDHDRTSTARKVRRSDYRLVSASRTWGPSGKKTRLPTLLPTQQDGTLQGKRRMAHLP